MSSTASGTTPCSAVPRPAPEPEPAARPGWPSQHALNHPALTGTAPAAVSALAAALDIPFRARREQRRYTAAAGPASGPQAPAHTRKLDPADHLLATLIRRHLNLPVPVIAALLGATGRTVSHAISLTGSSSPPGITLPPAAPPPAIPCAP